jgi:hypothetical protein
MAAGWRIKTVVRRAWLSAVLVGLIGLAFLLGGWVHRERLWPFGRGYLDAAVQPTVRGGGSISGEEPAAEPGFGEFRRLSYHPHKRLVDCPQQTDRTMVAFAFGQSNSANHGGERHRATNPVVNYFQGRCYDGNDPLLGATGIGGTPWGRMADRLIEDGLFDEVVLVPAGVINTSIERWRAGGDLNRLLAEELKAIQGRYQITHFLWHQGESDQGRGVDYGNALGEVIATTRRFFPESKFFVSVATRCGLTPPDAILAREQMQATALTKRVFIGPNTDDIDARYDDCHFSGKGLDLFAQRLVQWIKNETTASPANGQVD